MCLDAMLQNAVSCSFFTFSLMQNLGKKSLQQYVASRYYPIHWAKKPCSLHLTKAEKPRQKLLSPINNLVMCHPTGIPTYLICCKAQVLPDTFPPHQCWPTQSGAASASRKGTVLASEHCSFCRNGTGHTTCWDRSTLT